MAENEQKTGQERISELEGLLAGKAEELNQASSRLAELEKSVTEANDRLGKLDGSLKQAVAGYRTMMVKSNPEVLPELLSGETMEALDDSLVKAKELIGKVKSGLEAQAASTRIPAGAPQRAGLDMGSLSPREKIVYGIGRVKSKA